jgi:MIP family channel proteins
MPDRLIPALVSEAIGTFTLCFVGILAIHSAALTSPEGTVPLVLIAFAHGLAIFVMVAALGANSGAHFNPAVTAGFMATGRIPLPRGGMYIAAQLAGALLASAIIEGGFADSGLVANGTPVPAETVTWAGALVMEAFATFFLVLVVFGTAVDERAPRAVFPLAIGLTVAMGIMAIGPLTGGAMNPARVLGPAVVGGQWASHWVYWVGPILGGIAGAFTQSFLMVRGAPTARTAARGGPAPAEQRFGEA